MIDTELPNRKKIEFNILYAIMGIISGLLILVGYWMFIPITVLEVKKLPVPVTESQNIKSGRLIILKFDYCKKQALTGYVERQLISQRLILDLPPYEENIGKGCGKIEAPTVLPYTVATQDFHIHYKVSYKVNPLRTEVTEFDTATFQILPTTELPAE